MLYRNFEISFMGVDGDCGYYITKPGLQYTYLWKDLTLHIGSTGWATGIYEYGKAPGYYESERLAMEYIDRYLEKHLTFIVKERVMYSQRGWYIVTDKRKELGQNVSWFLWKNLKLHVGTGWGPAHRCGEAPGYYYNKETAEMHLKNYKEKQNMSESIEINVKVNGKVVPLSTISAETFENIKAKEQVRDIPRYRKGKLFKHGMYNRIIIKCGDNIVRAYDENGREWYNWPIDDDIEECKRMYFDIVPILS